ncbi:MAG TPA: glycosyltransferase family 4 protein [Solirubrobacteraceae bacterium]
MRNLRSRLDHIDGYASSSTAWPIYTKRTKHEGVSAPTILSVSVATKHHSNSRRPSVLLVHASAELYGSDRACLTMASAAVTAGLDTHVIVPTVGPLVARLETAGADVHILDPLILRRSELHGLRALGTIARWPATVLALRRLSRQFRFDLVHSNCAPTIGGAFLAHWWDVPHVWHVHEIFEDQRIARVVFERLLTHADVVVAASRSISDQFQSDALRDRCRVVYTGGEVPPEIVCAHPLNGSPVELICVGRLNHWKGQDFLIHAVDILRGRGMDINLKLVGEVFASQNHFRQQLEELVTTLELTASVSFLGERRDALQLMANADIVVVPSSQPEPFGIVLIEAMALGRPVVATDAGGPREIVTTGHDGLLVTPGNATALADAIGQLVEDPDNARRLGSNARLTAKKFTPRTLADHALSIYDELLDVKG